MGELLKCFMYPRERVGLLEAKRSNIRKDLPTRFD